MLRATACAILLFLADCSSTKKGEEQEKEILHELPAPLSSELPKGEIVRTSRGASFSDMIDDLAEADVVYVGESHTDKDHHLVQLRVIEYLHARGRLHAIGMEMFQRRFQDVLDAYTQGRIGEQGLIEGTEYKRRWGYDFALYPPILEFARKWRLPVIALNVEQEIRKKVSAGGVDALTEKERATLPAITPGPKPHRAYVKRTYQGHLKADEKFDEEKFERFYTVMCLWDAVMADSVVRWYRAAPKDAQVVVLAGTGHLRYHYGIPDRVRNRIGKSHMTVIPMSIAQSMPPGSVHNESYADFIWLTGKKK